MSNAIDHCQTCETRVMCHMERRCVASAAGAGSPEAGSKWHLMAPNGRYLHCKLSVCSFTPLVTGDSTGGLYVKYYAHGKKNQIECRCSIHEWLSLVKSGRIRKANVKDHSPIGAVGASKPESNSAASHSSHELRIR